MTWERLKPIEAPSCTAHGQCPKQNNDGASIFLSIFNNSHSKIKEVTLWNLSIRGLRSFRRSLLPSVPVWLWGVVNLMEGYGNDNPGAKSQGIKQLMAGGGVVLIGTTLIPLLSGLF